MSVSKLVFCFFIGLNALLCATWEEDLQHSVQMGTIPHWMQAQIEPDFDRCDPRSFRKENKDKFKEGRLSDDGPNLLLVSVTIDSGTPQITPLGGSDAWWWSFGSIKRAIEKLCAILPLPDVEFIVSLHDSLDPYLPSIETHLPFPVLVFARLDKAYQQILIPDFEIFMGYGHFLDEVRRASSAFPWESKEEKAIWRGTTTGGYYTKENYRKQWRTQLVEQSFAHPDLIDARFSSICQHENGLEKEMESYFGNYVSIFDHLRCKYQILIDGNTSAFSRAYWQLHSNSLIFKQDSPYIQWYYGAIRPYSHYIPFANDSSNLAERINWAREDDDFMRQVIENGNEFAENNLRTQDNYLYLYLVILELAKRQ